MELNTWLADELSHNNSPDVYALGFQEVQPLSGLSVVSTDESRGAAWREAVETAVTKVGSYVTIGARQMIGVFLIVLVKKKHCPFVQNVALVEAGTGFMRTGGNKGGVSCRFVLYDKTVCCVSSHLAAHDYNLERRNQDFHDVIRKSVFEIDFPEKSPFSYRDPVINGDVAEQDAGDYAEPTLINLLEHDVVLWIGDLNYRIDELPVERVCGLIDDANWAELAKFDQLINVMEGGEAFQGFEELRLEFAPTYKYDAFGTGYEIDDEDGELKRKPAWTDRVLWRDRIRSSSRSSADPEMLNMRNLKGTAESGGLRANNYRRHEILSSDHRPVSAMFDIDVSIIDTARRNKTVERIHMNLRKQQNLLRPRLSLSAMTVNFGKVEFNKVVDAPFPVVVRNLGHVPIAISIRKENIPGWLQVGDTGGGMAFTLAPFQEQFIKFRVHVQPGSGVSTRLNMGSEKVMTGLPLSIHGKSDAFITVFGDYKPTCFGNTIAHLAGHPKPFLISTGEQNVPSNMAEPSRASYASRALPVPKEIHLLISFLVRGCPLQPSFSSKAAVQTSNALSDTCPAHTNKQLFLEECEDAEVELVRRHLDEGNQIPNGTSVSAVASCLIALLDSLEEPLIPYACYDACIALAYQGEFALEDVELTLQRAKARAPVYNTIVYLSAFLNELPGMKPPAGVVRSETGIQTCVDAMTVDGDSYYGAVLALFTKVILKPPPEDDPVLVINGAEADWADRVSFVGTLLMLCSNGALEAIFDYSC